MQSYPPRNGGPFEAAVNRIAEDLVHALSTAPPDFDALVEKLRAKIQPTIQQRCGTMKILTMELPIDLGGIYTAVNVLETRPRRERKSLDEIAESLKSADHGSRVGMTAVATKRVPADQVAETASRLLILGGPGAGKTTFLRRLAFRCIKGEFRSNLVPAFIEFRGLGDSTLLEAARAFWQTDPGPFLKAGRALLLLDGLDELPAERFPRIRAEIEALSADYPDCPILMTCRVAAREYVFQHFREVEVADFDKSQREAFARNWFRVRQLPEKTEAFLNGLDDHTPLAELGSNPLLLTLLCLIFERRTDFDGGRAE